MRIAVFASHEGTTLQAVLDACASGRIAGQVALVVSNNKDSGALRRARAAGITAAHLSSKTNQNDLDEAILARVTASDADLIVLAGYLKQIGPQTLAAFAGRIWNTHPALLPAFGGQGMYGDRVHEAVLASGDSVSGASVHLVTENYDEGPVLARAEVPVLARDDVASLRERVRTAERELLVDTLARRAAVPQFITHYHLTDRRPFLSLSELAEDETDRVLGLLAAERAAGRHHRPFGRGYLRMRAEVERRLRESFVAAGGRPQRAAPHYFVLGQSAWFRGLSPDMRSVSLPLAELPDDATSVTYPDSFTAMAVAPEFGLPYEPKPYHNRVFRLAEVPALIAEHGLPADERDTDYATFADRPFERYLEVQVWSDGPVDRLLRDYLR